MGPGDEQAAEERRRLGREYLARRNMEMSALKQKRGVGSFAAEELPSSRQASTRWSMEMAS